MTGNAPRLIKVSSPYPFPEKLALEFLEGMEEVLCVEELDPVIERALEKIRREACFGLKAADVVAEMKLPRRGHHGRKSAEPDAGRAGTEKMGRKFITVKAVRIIIL